MTTGSIALISSQILLGPTYANQGGITAVCDISSARMKYHRLSDWGVGLAVCPVARFHHAFRLGGPVVFRLVLVARTGSPQNAEDEDDDKAADRKNSQDEIS